MSTDIHNITFSVVKRILRPLVRILLRTGVSFKTFSELAKRVYVEVAFNEFALPGRKQSISRVSVITGLSRKEVDRVMSTENGEDLKAVEKYNRATRVIGGWLKDGQFLNGDGLPAPLLLDTDETSNEATFFDLVKTHSGDVPARAVLDELLNAGAVEVNNGYVRLLTRGYIVTEDEAAKLNILGTDVSQMIATIDHNIVSEPSDAFFQRKTYYDNIPEDSIEEARALLSKKGAEFVEEMDKALSRFDRDLNPSVKGKGRKGIGIATFYVESGDS